MRGDSMRSERGLAAGPCGVDSVEVTLEIDRRFNSGGVTIEKLDTS